MLELALKSDRDAVNRLARQVHGIHVQWSPDRYVMTDELYPEDRFSEAVARRGIYVAKVNGVVLGYLAVNIRTRDGIGRVKQKVMVLEELCVEEMYRRQGIGTAMVQDLRALARAFGCRELILNVLPQNDAGVTFYQKMGFMISGISMQAKL